MKTLRNLIAAASAAVFVLAGCQEEIFNQPVESDNYYASAEAFTADTRTALGQGRSVVWSAGDQVAIFEGTSAGKAYQVTEASVGSGTGEFTLVKNLCTDATAEIPENTIAIYPFSKSLTVEPASNSYFYVNAYNINGITFPSRQTYTPGSFSDEAFPMIAVTQKGGRELAFKNIGGVIKLSLTGSCAVSEITIEGHNNEYLSGPIEISLTPPDNKFNTGANIYIVPNRTSKSVTLVCDPAVQLDSEKATDFFISIPPTEFKSGFTATITDSEGNKSTKSTNKANEVRRSTILAMPEVDNDRDKEIQKYESPYGYDVTKFVKGIEKDIEFPEDVQIIMDWLKEQEFVESVECDEYYKVIHIKFKDSTDFYIVNEQDERILQLSPPSCGEVIIGGLTYNIESQSDEVIQDNNKILYVRADAENPIFYEDGISSKYTPVDIEVVTTDGFDYFEDDLSAYGSILISHTHGVPQGHFCISDSSIPDGKAIRGIIRDVDEKTFHPTCITDYKDLYSRIGNNDPFVFANYCWSAKGVEDYVSIGSFVGYDILSYIKENADNSDSYFSGLFKGMTHLEAFNRLSAMDFPAWAVPETGDARDWTPYVHTTPQQYGEPNMRYYSITTEEPDTKDGKTIIKGKINGYKNLRDDVQYKVFIYDGTRSTMPQFPETAIDLTVADDGTIHQDISEYLEPDIEYSFNIGIEYYDNYYIGDSKKIMKEATQEYIQQFESPYGYEVSKFVRNIGKDVEFPEDARLITKWLKNQVFVESVECAEYYRDIHARFKDGTDFHVINIQESDYEEEVPSIASAVKSSESETRLVYNIESISNEVIQDNNKMLYVRGDVESDDFSEEEIFTIETPLAIEIVQTNGFNYFKEDLSAYGSILISHTHGVPQGHFCITDFSIPNDKKITGIIREIQRKTFGFTYITDKKDIYSRIRNNHPFVFVNCCWSAKGAKESVTSGSFVGYDVLSLTWQNVQQSKNYYSKIFNGLTHIDAFNGLPTKKFGALVNPETNEYDWEAFWAPYIYTKPQHYGEPNQRYFSIATGEPEDEDGKAIIKGQIKGYKNLKPQVKDNIKVYLYDGVEAGNPQNATITVDLNVADDGTIEQNISGNLEPNIEYTFQIGFEYNGNYYIGESKNITLQQRGEVDNDKWVDLGLSVLWASRNLGAQSPNNYGEYYAWGEVTTSPRYNWYSYDFSFYVSDEKPAYWACTYLGDDISGTSYDAASKNWGGGARMPTLDEINELIEKCTAETGELNGTYGKYFTGPNGNTIFLPFAGGYGDKQENYGKSGSYWSSTLSPGGANSWAYTLSMSSNYDPRGNISLRYYGHSIRPVKSK